VYPQISTITMMHVLVHTARLKRRENAIHGACLLNKI